VKIWHKVALGFGGLVVVALLLNLALPSEGKNEEFQPQNVF
jgi:hypothetical protein